MNNKNRFIIFSVVIIVLIIVSFSSLIVTADTKISQNIIRDNSSSNIEENKISTKKLNNIL